MPMQIHNKLSINITEFSSYHGHNTLYMFEVTTDFNHCWHAMQSMVS